MSKATKQIERMRKEGEVEFELDKALSQTRDEPVGLSLKRVAELIDKNFSPSEQRQIIKNLERRNDGLAN